VTDAHLAADRLKLGITPAQVEAFIANHGVDGAVSRLERIGAWLAEVNSQNFDGVLLTPAITDFLAGKRDIEPLIAELQRLREEPRCGRFDRSNVLQRELELKRFVSECARQKDLPKTIDKQREMYDGLPDQPPPAPSSGYPLSEQDALEARRAAYEAVALLTFLRWFKANTDRPIVVAANDRYGRHWVVEPIENILMAEGFHVRYDRVQSHSSMRLTVPHYLERWNRSGFPPEFVRQLSREMPHVVSVDECSPRRTERYSKYARGVRDILNWFMVFNDLRAQGDLSRYAADSSMPEELLVELRKWYEFELTRRKMADWVEPGETYAVVHWAPDLKPEVILGDIVVPARPVDPSRRVPLAVLANPAVYENEKLPQDLHDTHPYYFNDPEYRVKEKIVYGFGPHGFETRVEGFTTDEYVSAAQKAISEEIKRKVR